MRDRALLPRTFLFLISKGAASVSHVFLVAVSYFFPVPPLPARGPGPGSRLELRLEPREEIIVLTASGVTLLDPC